MTESFEKRRLRPISAYNVSTVRASKKVQLSRIGSRLRVSTEEMRTLVMSKLFSIEYSLQVSLHENLQQRGCSTVIFLSNGP